MTTFRPTVRAYAKGTLGRVAIAVPVLSALLLVNQNTRGLALVLVGVALATIAGVLLYIARARVFVNADLVGKRGFGSTRWFATADVRRALLAEKLKDASGTTRTELFLFGHDGALQLRLKNDLWATADLRSIALATGAEQQVMPQLHTIAQLGRLEPTALTRMESNPKELTVIVVVVFFLVATPIAFFIATAVTP